MFYLAEEVLSRGISRLVASGAVKLMIRSRNLCLCAHTLSVDDFFSARVPKSMFGLFSLFFLHMLVLFGRCLLP